MKKPRCLFLRFKACLTVLSFFIAQGTLFAQLPAPGVSAAGGGIPDGLVGVVAAARGEVEIIKADEVGRVAGSGEAVYLGDEVRTDAKGNLQILLLDETVFTIGPNSAIVIDTFVYDPATHDGKIDARVVQGVFRFITGQIARKKPSSVEVKLPTGSVGVRGTIFYGKVEGERSTILLLGPGEKNNTGSRSGRVIVSNEVDGKTVQTEVKKSGFGSVIEGQNVPPTPAFEIPKEQINEMIASVSPSAESEESESSASSSGQDSSGSSDTAADSDGSASDTDDGGLAFSEDSATEQAGQDGASAYLDLQDISTVTEIDNLLSDTSTDASFDIGDEDAEDDASGGDSKTQATYDELRARTESGVNHYSGTGTMGFGTYNILLDIDFANKHFGGGNSRVEVMSSVINSGSKTTFNVLTTYSYSALSGDAQFSNIALAASVVTGSLDVDFFDAGDSIEHSFTATKGADTDSGSGTADFTSGPAGPA